MHGSSSLSGLLHCGSGVASSLEVGDKGRAVRIEVLQLATDPPISQEFTVWEVGLDMVFD